MLAHRRILSLVALLGFAFVSLCGQVAHRHVAHGSTEPTAHRHGCSAEHQAVETAHPGEGSSEPLPCEDDSQGDCGICLFFAIGYTCMAAGLVLHVPHAQRRQSTSSPLLPSLVARLVRARAPPR